MKLQIPIKTYSKLEITQALNEAYNQTADFLDQLSDDALRKSTNGKWSPIEHFQHLILSSKGIPTLLKTPKEKLAFFGKPENGSRTF